MVGGIYAVLFMLLLVFIFGTIRKMVKLALTIQRTVVDALCG